MRPHGEDGAEFHPARAAGCQVSLEREVQHLCSTRCPNSVQLLEGGKRRQMQRCREMGDGPFWRAGASASLGARWLGAWWCAVVLVVLQLPVQVRGTCTPLPTVNRVGAKLGLIGTVTDPSKQLSGVAVLGPQVINADSSVAQRERVDVVVGSELELNITASWAAPYLDHNLTLYAYEDPGVPNGGILTTQECRGGTPLSPSNPLADAHSGSICNPVRRIFKWRPSKGQEARMYSMCFLVLPKEVPACQSAYKCIDINVHAPNMTFNYEVTPARDREFHSPVGCRFEACLEAQDLGGLYDTDIAAVSSSMPEGAMLDAECGMNSETTLPYASTPGGAGEASVYPLYASSLAEQIPPMPRRRGACKKCFRWEAPRGTETQTKEPCFVAQDASGLRSVTTCWRIHVPKCKYCVHGGDTLQFLNKRYQLNSNWLQLWNSNGDVMILHWPWHPYHFHLPRPPPQQHQPRCAAGVPTCVCVRACACV